MWDYYNTRFKVQSLGLGLGASEMVVGFLGETCAYSRSVTTAPNIWDSKKGI